MCRMAAPRKKNARYTKDDLVAAVEAVRSFGASFGEASKRFNVPKTTIADRISGKRGMIAKRGRKQDIPFDIEKDMVQKMLDAADKGFPLTKKSFLVQVARLVKRLRLQTRFRDGIPGNEYWVGVKARFPEICLRVAEALPSNRMKMVNREVVGKYFDDLGKLVHDLHLEERPHLRVCQSSK